MSPLYISGSILQSSFVSPFYQQLSNILEEEGAPINIFRFVVNPNDFAQSVENIFYLSFLIRDGKVAFETNEDGEPVVCKCPVNLYHYNPHIGVRQTCANNPVT